MLGVLLMNTGTPDDPSPEAIRAYLKEFLSDKNLINVPDVIWKPVLNLCILPNRPKRTAPIYEKFWTPEGSPFLLTSMEQQDKLQSLLEERLDEPARVLLGMRYGNPAIAHQLQRLIDEGAREILALPLYPQYTKACAGTCFDCVRSSLDRLTGGMAISERPRISFVREYWNERGYLDLLSASVKNAWAYAPGSKLIVSFHSVPVSFIKNGDTYASATASTARELAEALGIPLEDMIVAYQSRFDSRKWLGPMLPNVLEELAAQGVEDVAVVCPGFSVDCIETAHEVAGAAGELFMKKHAESHPEGSPHFTYIPALGAADEFVEFLASLVCRQIG